MQALVETTELITEYTVINMQDQRSALQAHVDEREEGRNNSISMLVKSKYKKKTKIHSTLIMIL